MEVSGQLHDPAALPPWKSFNFINGTAQDEALCYAVAIETSSVLEIASIRSPLSAAARNSM
jgi:hypothetical protein